MGDPDLKQVRFDKYCKLCRWDEKKEAYDPCNNCLEIGMREGTEKPEYFEEPFNNGRKV